MTRNGWLKGLWGIALLALLAVSGCTGTEMLSNGNVEVTIEVVTEGTTDQPYDCTLWTIASMNIVPLDGTCSGGPHDGEPCYDQPECDGGTCEGGTAQGVLGSNGVFVVTGGKGNLEGTSCEATLDSGFGSCTWECAPNAGNPPCPIFPKDCEVGNPDPDVTCNPLLADPDGNPNVCAPRYSFQAEAPAFVPPAPMILSAGRYRVSQLSVGPAGLYSDTPDGGGEPTLRYCTDANVVDDQYDTEDLTFNVIDGQTAVIRFVVNVDALEDALPDANSCAGFTANILDIQEIRTVP